jgi:hypothetical protein
MLLPFAHQWPVRCAKCSHRGTVTASLADLAIKQLKCLACGYRQAFAPEAVAPAKRRRRNGWAREARAAAKSPNLGNFKSDNDLPPDPMLNDRLDDLVFAG